MLLVVGVVLLTTSVGAVAFLPFVACMLMMGAMMWFMMRPRRTMTAAIAGGTP